jgi:hypothetical protein
MTGLYARFFNRLPVRRLCTDGQLHLLDRQEIRRLRLIQHTVMAIAATFSVLGFLAYYLPVYWNPQWFPALQVSLPFFDSPVSLAWAEFLWGIVLMNIELWALTFLNLASVHEIAVTTGFLNADNKAEKGESLLKIGLEICAPDARRYGIDPFQGMNLWALFLFNLVLRFKGWLGNHTIRFLTRLLLGRYAVRAVLDFIGMPIYMAINVYSVHTVMREAKVILLGQSAVGLLLQRLPKRMLSSAEQDLVYDTLQYIAINKRDFHGNHYLLTRSLLDHFQIPPKPSHLLSEDYLDKVRGAVPGVQALCRLVILLGFILDGRLSWRERRELRRLNDHRVLPEGPCEVKRRLRDFLGGAGMSAWSEAYLAELAAPAAAKVEEGGRPGAGQGFSRSMPETTSQS